MNHSCMLGFVEETSEAMERGCQEDVLVMDFSKAFDRVYHNLLIHKFRHYGLSGKVNLWIENSLANKNQAAVVGGSRSDFAPVQ